MDERPASFGSDLYDDSIHCGSDRLDCGDAHGRSATFTSHSQVISACGASWSQSIVSSSALGGTTTPLVSIAELKLVRIASPASSPCAPLFLTLHRSRAASPFAKPGRSFGHTPSYPDASMRRDSCRRKRPSSDLNFTCRTPRGGACRPNLDVTPPCCGSSAGWKPGPRLKLGKRPPR